MEEYDGVGTYTSSELTVRARLQEEADLLAIATAKGVEATITWADEELSLAHFKSLVSMKVSARSLPAFLFGARSVA